MFRDLRLACRHLLRQPGLSAAAIFILALGLGANAVVFSLVHGLMLAPLDFDEPDRIVRFYGTEDGRGRDRQRVSELTVDLVREHSRGYSTIAGAHNMGLAVTDSERPLNPLMRTVTEGWFDLLGAQPLLGRTFAPPEHRAGLRTTVLSYGFWNSYFGADPDILGRTIELANEPYEIIGVLAADYRNPAFPQTPVLWLPAADNPAPQARQRNRVLLGRLADDTSMAAAQQDADRVMGLAARQAPETHAQRGVRVLSLHRSLVEQSEPALIVLFVAVGFVLLIACSNVANLLLARTLHRKHEVAVRRALGAGRFHIVRQLASESLIISGLGAGLGLLGAAWSLGPLGRLAPSNVPVPLLDRVSIQPAVMIFSIVLALVTTVVISLLPLRQLLASSGRSLAAGSARAIGGVSRRRLRASLVIVELALSMVLLVGAGLTIRSLHHLRSMELGFEPENLLACRVGARGGDYDQVDRWAGFHEQALNHIANLPGVARVGGIEFIPLFAGNFGTTTPMAADGSDRPPDARIRATEMSATPGYLGAHGQTLVHGRELAVHDTATSEPVAMVNQELARQLWADANPVGKLVLVGDGSQDEAVRVVGVVANIRGVANNPQPAPILFRPLTQRPVSNITVLTRLDPGAANVDSMLPAIEDAVWSISRDAPVYGFATVHQLLSDLEWQPRFLVQLLTGFALLALVLAATGIYSVLAYAVSERTREIGIRMAIGASRRDILGMVTGNALRLSMIGIAIGGAAAWIGGRGLESLLLGVSAQDPWTFATVATLLTLIAVAAGSLPARRALRIQPVEALRDT